MTRKKLIRNIIITGSLLLLVFFVGRYFMAPKEPKNYSPARGFFVHGHKKACSRNTEFTGDYEKMKKLCPEGFRIIRRVRI